MKEILTLNNLTKVEILKILKRAKELEHSSEPKKLQNVILSTLFFEPSTRTKLSFTAAMYRLGGKVINLDGDGNSSLKKGESISDTIMTMGLYSDIMAVRSLYEGVAKRASELLDIPVINAGDGSNQHPTQTLLDLYTIQKEKKTLDNLTVAFIGDLKYGRTVHSLAIALNKFSNNKIYFIAPNQLQIPKYILDSLSLKYELSDSYEDIIKYADIIYMTRLQKERFDNLLDCKYCEEKYKIDKEIIKISKSNVKIMHPLPRNNEIHTNLDNLDNSVYFSQVKNSVFVRQSILSLLIESHEKPIYDGIRLKCTNPKCISYVENLEGKWIKNKDIKICFYCEK